MEAEGAVYGVLKSSQVLFINSTLREGVLG